MRIEPRVQPLSVQNVTFHATRINISNTSSSIVRAEFVHRPLPSPFLLLRVLLVLLQPPRRRIRTLNGNASPAKYQSTLPSRLFLSPSPHRSWVISFILLFSYPAHSWFLFQWRKSQNGTKSGQTKKGLGPREIVKIYLMTHVPYDLQRSVVEFARKTNPWNWIFIRKKNLDVNAFFFYILLKHADHELTTRFVHTEDFIQRLDRITTPLIEIIGY